MHTKRKKRAIIIVAFLAVSTLLFDGWFLIDQHKYQVMVSHPSDVQLWDADPRPLQSTKTAKKQISQIKQRDRSLAGVLNEAHLVVVPGLRGAWSIDAKTKKAAFGNDWVPQGVTQSTADYYVSLYDGDHRLDSIIVQIDKKTGKYTKTLILKSKAHVGGIYYDISHQHLLWSDDRKTGAGISYASKPQIDAYHAARSQAPIPSKRIKWELGKRTSAITLYDNQLVVVKYGRSKDDRSVMVVPLDQNGLPREITRKKFNGWIEQVGAEKTKQATFKKVITLLIKKKIINSYNPGWDRLQGVAIAQQGFTLLTQSNGSLPGKVWARQVQGDVWSKLKYTTPKEGAKVVNVPHSVEEVSLNTDDSLMTLVFESGAKKYREEGFFMRRHALMDRLIVEPISITVKDK